MCRNCNCFNEKRGPYNSLPLFTTCFYCGNDPNRIEKDSKLKEMYETEIRSLYKKVNDLKNEDIQVRINFDTTQKKTEALQIKMQNSLKTLYDNLLLNNKQVNTFDIAEYMRKNF